VTFDPFYDFEERGYLRNFAGEKDLALVKRLEHSSFTTGIDEAFKRLAKIERLTYPDVLDTHKILFEAVYPWAGQDRELIAPGVAVSKGSIIFAHPNDAKVAVDHALRLGQDKDIMASRPGEVMGYLAFGHPFLDGNGRTIMTVHAELAQRAGISIDWAATNKADYLTSLTRELHRPAKGHLDAYLKPHVRTAIGTKHLAGHVLQVHGLDGDRGAANVVLGKFSEPGVQARYQLQVQRRQQQGKS
jgi:cell filamentation protein